MQYAIITRIPGELNDQWMITDSFPESVPDHSWVIASKFFKIESIRDEWIDCHFHKGGRWLYTSEGELIASAAW